MKKLVLLLFLLLAAGWCFQACDNTKSYAEMLDDEKDAIKDFINENNITVITQSEFYAQDSTTDLSRNEYVQLASGVYMQIVSKGSDNPADTVKNNDLVLVRFREYNIMDKAYEASNLEDAQYVDEFRYTVTSSSITGLFTQGYMQLYHGTAVPAGWLVALSYVRNMGAVNLIVPSKMGASDAMSSVTPYHYEIKKFQIY